MIHHHHFFEFSSLYLKFNNKKISISNSTNGFSDSKKILFTSNFFFPKKSIFYYATQKKKKTLGKQWKRWFHALKIQFRLLFHDFLLRFAQQVAKRKIWTIFHGISAITIDLTSRYRGQGISKIPCRRKCISFPELEVSSRWRFTGPVSCVFPFTRPSVSIRVREGIRRGRIHRNRRPVNRSI